MKRLSIAIIVVNLSGHVFAKDLDISDLSIDNIRQIEMNMPDVKLSGYDIINTIGDGINAFAQAHPINSYNDIMTNVGNNIIEFVKPANNKEKPYLICAGDSSEMFVYKPPNALAPLNDDLFFKHNRTNLVYIRENPPFGGWTDVDVHFGMRGGIQTLAYHDQTPGTGEALRLVHVTNTIKLKPMSATDKRLYMFMDRTIEQYQGGQFVQFVYEKVQGRCVKP
ncbi:MAG: hypothetical protein HY746_01120 [Elusimicrobia bacterium]|nr:hypothetical protein [Elusimicrobiota bacterium]